jgi:hypothetical protein
MKLWQRAVVAIILGITYLAVVRPVRGVILKGAILLIDESRIEDQGYKLDGKSPVQRVYVRKVDGKEFQFKAPIDSFFVYGLIFSALYGVPLMWMGRIGVFHLLLWAASFFALLLAQSNAGFLNVTNGIAKYINPAVTLSVIPLWIRHRNRIVPYIKGGENV